MRVRRGRAETLAADREVTAAMVDQSARTTEPALRIWTPHPQVAFGRRDSNAAGYDRARELARDRGLTPVERDVGGRAVAFTPGTLAFSLAEPRDGKDRAVRERYDRVLERLAGALSKLGTGVSRGEPAGAFCPGSHSLQADGKVAGLAQRVRDDVAVVGGFIVVSDGTALADVLAPVYEALSVPFDPDSVGSLAAAGGPSAPEAVVPAVIEGLAADRAVRMDSVER
jgi:lipoate-protein ligase A